MPITLNPVTGELDAEIVDDNFTALETFLKEGLIRDDFQEDVKFNQYKIRRYTSGKIVSFNAGSTPNSEAQVTQRTGTFENNWIAGTKAISYVQSEATPFGGSVDFGGLGSVISASGWVGGPEFADGVSERITEPYDHPLYHPFELLGYPGGSLYYDFQEQGFADPVSYYKSLTDYEITSGWPPGNSPIGRFPEGQCWSRWLTIPDAAGKVYVDEPCVAIISAQVKGNYFFTPTMRVHGANVSSETNSFTIEHPDEPEKNLIVQDLRSNWHNPPSPGEPRGEIQEGMHQSAMIRLGLFVDTNPVVWDDEFFNGNDYGNSSYGSGHGFNPWIGSDPTGKYQTTRPDGVSRTRSWKKITDLTCRVRQRGSYKIIGAVELKGRRSYNFSLKFRPASTFGYVTGYQFVSGFYDMQFEATQSYNFTADDNMRWNWGPRYVSAGTSGLPGLRWFYPGTDALVTNMVESSGISVEFFYGQTLSNLEDAASELVTGFDPIETGEDRGEEPDPVDKPHPDD